MTKHLHELTIHEALAGMRRGDFTSRALTEALLARIDALDDRIRAYLTVTAEHALAQADAADAR
ncbi:MAG: Asp-tRNA(Asn)/Glu-tRNA(Gln) amidotransferase GatCAB subunit A, partial [Caldilineaceae bacterium]